LLSGKENHNTTTTTKIMSYYIAKKEYYYGPEEKFGWVIDPDGPPKGTGFDAAYKFPTLEQAQDWIEDGQDIPYMLSHNEASRPDYKILNEAAAERLASAWEHDDLGAGCYDWDHCQDPENPTDQEEIEAMRKLESKTWDAVDSLESKST
jgi:hypothetical protein